MICNNTETFSIHAPQPQATELKGTKQILICVVLAISFLYEPRTLIAAGPAPVDLRSAARFTILAGAAITTTGGGAINGDVGASPIGGTAIGVTAAQVKGTIYATDDGGPAGAVKDPDLLIAAKGHLTAAYNEARDRVPVDVLNPGVAGNIGGLNLDPGLYKFTGTASITGLPLTLTGGPDDVWIFQIATELEVGSSIQVILAGGAQSRNIFWQVGSSATIGTSAVFKGTIMANQAVTMDTGSTLDGRALAFTAGVTYNGNSGSLPTPKAPSFTGISIPTNDSVALVLSTAPYFLLTLQTSTNLSFPDWTTIVTNTPITNLWTYTNNTPTATVTQRFYRAFITPYVDAP